MKIVTQPLTFEAGESLVPEDLNAVFQYAADAVADAAEKRYREVVLPLSFEKSAGSGYANTDSSEVRSFRFVPPATCYITRGYLTANLTSDAAVNVTLREANTGLEPQGATDPWLSTDEASADASETITDFNPDRVLLVKDTEYVFRVESTGTFTIERFEVSVHLLLDRWTPAGATDVPSFEPVLLDESSGVDAAVVAANQADFAAETAKFSAKDSAPVPFIFALHDFTAAADPDLTRFYLPRFDSARATARIVRIDLFATMAAAGGFGELVAANVYDETGTYVGGAEAFIQGVTEAHGVAAISISLAEATAGISANEAKDFYLYLYSTSLTTCRKAYAVVWIDTE